MHGAVHSPCIVQEIAHYLLKLCLFLCSNEGHVFVVGYHFVVLSILCGYPWVGGVLEFSWCRVLELVESCVGKSSHGCFDLAFVIVPI